MFAIENQEKMRGEAYNLGNDTLNCSKIELAKKIAERVPRTTINIGIGKDLDQRNYKVSSSKLANLKFKTIINLDKTIRELIQFYSLFPTNKVSLQQLTRTMYNK
jgi:nucleoside-diphosphate-sugar epimerase